MNSNTFTRWQNISLVLMRVLIGWHLLHEGMVKLLDANWTSLDYLKESKWILSGIFTYITEHPGVLKVVDCINIWGLIAIGISLIIGLFTRYAILTGIVLLSLYYLASIPIPGFIYSSPMEGNYLIVNKTLIETSALIVLLFFPTSKYIGLDRYIKQMKK